MDELRDQLENLIQAIMTSEGTDNNELMTGLLASLNMRIHEAKYFTTFKTVRELEDHIIGCTDCLNHMMPLDVFWQMTHHTDGTQCETPMHSKDRFMRN